MDNFQVLSLGLEGQVLVLGLEGQVLGLGLGLGLESQVLVLGLEGQVLGLGLEGCGRVVGPGLGDGGMTSSRCRGLLDVSRATL